MHAQLREATADQHQRLDRGLSYLLGDDLSRSRYADLLAAFYGFYVPLEDCFARWQAVSGVAGLPLIRRAGLLECDLRAFGRAPEQVPTCAEMPTMTSADHVAGGIYVVEGACLGGQVIARAAMRRLAITPEHGAAFFTGAGAGTGPRWRQVLAWLDERDRDDPDRTAVAAGACRTFVALSNWLRRLELLDE